MIKAARKFVVVLISVEINKDSANGEELSWVTQIPNMTSGMILSKKS